MLTRILSIFFFLVAIALTVFLAYRIKFKIDEDRRIERNEEMVINKLKMIRDAEVAFQAVNGRYTGSWDTLISFIDTGHMYITERSEEIILKEYGTEDVIVTTDTIGKVSVKDSLFVNREPVLALAEGTVTELNMQEGGVVNRGDLLGTIQTQSGKRLRIKAPLTGRVEELYIREGSQVQPTSNVALLAYKRIGDVQNLPLIPGTNQRFELFAGKVTKGNVVVDVFEARDVAPQNPLRKRNPELALRVGSRTDVSTTGNWE
jgi:hypothetical protein